MPWAVSFLRSVSSFPYTALRIFSFSLVMVLSFLKNGFALQSAGYYSPNSPTLKPRLQSHLASGLAHAFDIHSLVPAVSEIGEHGNGKPVARESGQCSCVGSQFVRLRGIELCQVVQRDPDCLRFANGILGPDYEEGFSGFFNKIAEHFPRIGGVIGGHGRPPIVFWRVQSP